MVTSRFTARRIPLRREGEVDDARLVLGDDQVEGVELPNPFTAFALGDFQRPAPRAYRQW